MSKLEIGSQPNRFRLSFLFSVVLLYVESEREKLMR
jgi:hypothetical protein